MDLVQGAVWSCVLNQTALVAATASADFSAKVWNALTGDETYSFQHNHIVRTVTFAQQTPRLLTGGMSCLFWLLAFVKLNHEELSSLHS